MPTIELILPFVSPSINVCYRTYCGKVIKSKRLLDFENKMNEHFKVCHDNYDKLKGDLSLDVSFYLKGKKNIDLDNMLKALIDNLEGRLFDNDKFIVEINARKYNHSSDTKTIVTLKTL